MSEVDETQMEPSPGPEGADAVEPAVRTEDVAPERRPTRYVVLEEIKISRPAAEEGAEPTVVGAWIEAGEAETHGRDAAREEVRKRIEEERSTEGEEFVCPRLSPVPASSWDPRGPKVEKRVEETVSWE